MLLRKCQKTRTRTVGGSQDSSLDNPSPHGVKLLSGQSEGSVYKYNITSSFWSGIISMSGSDLHFGFGDLTIRLQNPDAVVVAANDFTVASGTKNP